MAPYDDPLVIAGQGTVGAEVVRQLGPKVDSLHAIFVAVGGGGLIAGIAAYIKQLCPHVKVCGHIAWMPLAWRVVWATCFFQCVCLNSWIRVAGLPPQRCHYCSQKCISHHLGCTYAHTLHP